MINIQFSAADKNALKDERYHHPHPRVQRKMEALWLKSQGLPHQEICRLTGISKGTLCAYLRDYQRGGIEQLKELSFYRPVSKLAGHASTLEAYFRQHPPATLKEAMAKIEQLTGIKRSEVQVRNFLISLGMKPRKIGMIPAKADADVQEAFKKEELEPRLEEAKGCFFRQCGALCIDPLLGVLWSFCRLFIQAPAGRKRFNVLGALNAITHQLIPVTNESYINAQSLCELLSKLHHFHLGVPITLVLDNARYQKCKLVFEQAESLGIELLYLPTYSPNLNLIERLWKFVKKTCLYSQYYPDFSSFKAAISDLLSHTQDTYKDELDSLLTLKFQTFKNAQSMPS